jgi:hypothetical protein
MEHVHPTHGWFVLYSPLPSRTLTISPLDNADVSSYASGSLGLKFRRREAPPPGDTSSHSPLPPQRRTRKSLDGSLMPDSEVSPRGNRGRSVSTGAHGTATMAHSPQLEQLQEVDQGSPTAPYSNISISVDHAPDHYAKPVEPAAVANGLLRPTSGMLRNALSLDTIASNSSNGLEIEPSLPSYAPQESGKGFYDRAKMQAAMQTIAPGRTSPKSAHV